MLGLQYSNQMCNRKLHEPIPNLNNNLKLLLFFEISSFDLPHTLALLKLF